MSSLWWLGAEAGGYATLSGCPIAEERAGQSGEGAVGIADRQ